MKILNFGSCNIDYVYSLDHITLSGETQTTANLETFCGGKGLNQSIAVSRAGASVFHAGCIGEGGGFLLEILKENNVDVSFMEHTDVKNGHAIIQVDKEGRNSIFLYPGSNEMISKEHIDKTLESFSKGDVLLLQNEINNLSYIVKKAYEKGMTIVLNPSPYNEKIEGIDLNMISYLVLNEIEAEAFSGYSEASKSLKYFADNFPRLRVMLTLGQKGCIYKDESCEVFHPVYKVDAVDTTAAGDTFMGYFVLGITSGNDISETLKIASCAAAISVTKKGAAPSIPHITEVLGKIGNMKTDSVDLKAKNMRSKIEEYIYANLENVTLCGLADFLGYTTVYTGTLVKKITGETYKGLLHRKRMQIAAQLLSETDMPVGEIIKKAGYENESFFRKIFKEYYGKNPLEYKKSGGR